MKKSYNRFICNECGYIASSWLGKCPECFSWNSFIEEIKTKSIDNKSINNFENDLININSIKKSEEIFINTDNDLIDNFFGKGIVKGSSILISGEPGIGKSSFLLFLVKVIKNNINIYYFSGEESKEQIKSRCDRLEIKKDNLYISNIVEIENLIEICNSKKPDIIFIDSIQTVFSKNLDSYQGTISQIKYCTSLLIEFAKKNNISLFIIGHITKTGEIAGPKILEHMVDFVIYFEGDFQYQYRILRSIKNRFGSTDEILIFEMKKQGLKIIENPSGYFIDNDDKENVIGKCKTVLIEGNRPILLEVEALVVPSIYPNPRRFSEGVDVARINRIAAILDKYLTENLNNYDIYFKISGGIKTKDVGIDLAIAVAIYSSKKKIMVSNNSIFLGELSLTGKIQNILRFESRIKEAIKFEMEEIIGPKIKGDIKFNKMKEFTEISKTMEYIFKL